MSCDVQHERDFIVSNNMFPYAKAETLRTHYCNDVTAEFQKYALSHRELTAFVQLAFLYVCNPNEWQAKPPQHGRPSIDELAHPKFSDAPVIVSYRLILETAITRAVDNFNHYITQMLYRTFTERPETLRTEQIPVRDALECATREELISYVAEKKVTGLGHKGLSDIVDYLNRNLSLEFDESEKCYLQACAIVELRNIIVHHGGRVTNRFIERTKTSTFDVNDVFPINVPPVASLEENKTSRKNLYALGGQFPLSETFIVSQLAVLTIVARMIDGRFIDKLGLSTVENRKDFRPTNYYEDLIHSTFT